jgi:uncharacterized protein YbjQ (UPF0145 family)
MIIVSTEEVAGREIKKQLGIARGNTVRARNIGSDIGASLKSLVGGKIGGYVKVLTQAREEVTAEMIRDAQDRGADAIVNVRYTTSQVMQGAAEVMVYGTAVTLGK